MKIELAKSDTQIKLLRTNTGYKIIHTAPDYYLVGDPGDIIAAGPFAFVMKIIEHDGLIVDNLGDYEV